MCPSCPISIIYQKMCLRVPQLPHLHHIPDACLCPSCPISIIYQKMSACAPVDPSPSYTRCLLVPQLLHLHHIPENGSARAPVAPSPSYTRCLLMPQCCPISIIYQNSLTEKFKLLQNNTIDCSLFSFLNPSSGFSAVSQNDAPQDTFIISENNDSRCELVGHCYNICFARAAYHGS